MCGLFFVCARVREARKRGWEISNFLGFLGIVGGGMKIFGIFGKFEFFGFQKGCRSLHILFEM
jgi:hypothetical protein